MSKYVFCDLDFTLLDNNREISSDNYDAIKKFEANGNHFIICSGRVPFALDKFKSFLSSTEVISSNGAVIISNDNIIKKQLLSKESLRIMTDYAIRNNINIRYFAKDIMYLLNQKYASKKGFMYKESKEVDDRTVYEMIDHEEIIKLVFSSDNHDFLVNVEKELNKMNLNVEISFSVDVFLEVNASNQNKGNGLLDYCKLNNIDIKDTVAIGDNDNDITMLKVAGFSACPSNAIDKVKNEVDYISIYDNDHNAVKDILEKITENE